VTVPAFTPFGGDEIPQSDLAAARAVVLPLCYEKAVSYGSGTRDGPLHLLDASLQLERLDAETLVDWGAVGLHTRAPIYPSEDPRQAVTEMQAAAAPILAGGRFLVSIGGDHAVSIGPIQAVAERYPDLSVLQFDAHLDLRDTWNGSPYNHACVMRRVVDDMGLPIVQVGIRAMAPEEHDFIQARGIEPFLAFQIDSVDFGWIDRVVAGLSAHVYLTIDLDGLDPSVLPGTGTPEPDGLSFRQLVRLIAAVGRQRRVVAADVVELAKIPGTQVSEFTAAKIVSKILVHCVGS